MSQNKIELIKAILASLKLAEELPPYINEILGDLKLLESEKDVIEAINDNVLRTKALIIITTPQVIPELFQSISEYAYRRKGARFIYSSEIDLSAYGVILQKMSALGNIQFRTFDDPINIISCTRDAEEVLIGIVSKYDSRMNAILATNEGLNSFYSRIIGPALSKLSRPAGMSKARYQEYLAKIEAKEAKKQAKIDAKKTKTEVKQAKKMKK